MACVRRMAAIAVLLAVMGGYTLARGGEAAPQPERFRHTLKGMFGKSSIGMKKRPWYLHVLYYLPSRGLDVVDCLSFEIAAGEGLHGNFHATRYLQLGYGSQESTRAGLDSRHLGIVDEQLKEAAIGWWWRLDLRRDNLRGTGPNLDISEADVAARYYKQADPLGVGLSAFVGLFGLSVELRPHELLDLLMGFGTLDPADDDL